MVISKFKPKFDRADESNIVKNNIKSKPKKTASTNVEHTTKIVTKQDKPLAKNSDYYLTGDLSKEVIAKLDKVINSFDEDLIGISGVLRKNAKDKNLPIPDVKLWLAQVRPVLMSYLNPRFFIGDKPGLGKTVMSAGCYAYYQIKCRQQGITPTKILVVTDTSHVLGFAEEWQEFGIKLLPLLDGAKKIKKSLMTTNLDEYEGIILNWDSLKTNGFLEFYLENSDSFNFAVFDETSKLLNDKSQLYKVVNNLVNNYQGGIERVIFLNGSSFEKNIFDFYYQFNILKPKLIPTKKFLEDRYIIRSGRNFYMRDSMYGGERSNAFDMIQRSAGDIIDYKNQAELRERLKYYYIARSKSDYSDDIPQHRYLLNVVEMTPVQKKIMDRSQLISLINSPQTSDKGAKFDRKTSPKLDTVVRFADSVSEDRPLIYVYNLEAQKTVQKELIAMGYKVGILNGDAEPTERRKIQNAFNNGELDMLIFNIKKAINLPTSNRILFYDIPTMPETTTQIRGRIDRNNYTVSKTYNFFCYLHSPEMINIVKLGYFREHHGGEFTGQSEQVYKDLVKQLHRAYSNSIAEEISTIMEDIITDDDFEEIRADLEDLLCI